MGVAKDAICGKLSLKVSKELKHLKNMARQVDNKMKSLVNQLASYAPSGVDIPNVPSLGEISKMGDCGKAGLGEMGTNFYPFGIETPEINIANAIGTINLSFDAQSSHKKLPALDKLLNCLDIQCGANTAGLIDEVSEAVAGINMSDGGILDTDELMSQAGIAGDTLKELKTKVTKTDNIKKLAKKKIKELVKL